jgi:hypothetical protein
MARALDKRALLETLGRIQYKKEGGDRNPLEQMSLADALLALAEVDHEREFKLCRLVAEHLLGEVPAPDDVDLDVGT